jgi:hypothetical protein
MNKSPLNGLAAKWAAQNSHLLPVDPQNIAPPLNGSGEKTAVAATPQLLPTAPPAAPQPGAEDPWSQKIVIS